MKKKIIMVVGIIIISSLLFISFSNFDENEKAEAKVWMAKAPHQCGDNTVPNSIYFDYPNAIFPGNNGFPAFPINFSQKQNDIEFRNKEIETYVKAMNANNRSEDEINEFLVEYESYNENKGNLSEEKIIIFDAKKIYTNGTTCSACFCSVGYTVYLLIEKEDINALLKLGYGQTEESIT